MTCCPRLRPQPKAMASRERGAVQSRHDRLFVQQGVDAVEPFRVVHTVPSRWGSPAPRLSDPPCSPPSAPLGPGASTVGSVKNRVTSYARPPAQPEPGIGQRTARRRVDKLADQGLQAQRVQPPSDPFERLEVGFGLAPSLVARRLDRHRFQQVPVLEAT